MAPPQIALGQATDPGLDPTKQVNEDCYGCAETALGHLFIVCDGMGGHVGGREASVLAVHTVIDQVRAAPPSASPGQALVAAIQEAGRRVYELGGPAGHQSRPGSTCVALLLHHDQLEVAHVGDSRAYAIRGNQIYRLTRDHSMVQELIDGGMLSEDDAIGHPDGNKITRALGMVPEIDVELRANPMEVLAGDAFVLATDGLTDLARDDDVLVTVAEYLARQGVQAAADELVALSNRRGGHDNITVQVLQVLAIGSRRAVTEIQAPQQAAAGAMVSTTIEEGPGGDPLGQTQPGLTETEPIIVTIPAPPPLVPSSRAQPPKSPLLPLLAAMALLIVILFALLIWALFLRQ